MAEEPNVKKYFEETVPQLFGGAIKTSPVQGMDGTEFTLQFNVTGEGGGQYGIVVKNGKELQVVPGRIPSPLIEIEVTQSNWKDTISGKAEGVMDNFMKPERTSRKLFDVVKETKGTLKLALTRDDGGLFESKIKFNGADAPATTIKMKVADYAFMNQG